MTKEKSLDVSGIKPRNPKQIAQAGMTLAAGMAFLPFIPFKKAGHYKPKIGIKNKK